MGFTLEVMFSGLCLFVRDTSNKVMYVLIPQTGPKAGDGTIHQHVVTLGYDEAYSPDGAAGNHDIGNKELQFQVSDPGLDLQFPANIVNLTERVGGRVPRSYLGAAPPLIVWSRIALEGGSFAGTEPGACWDFNGSIVEMAKDAIWTMREPTDSTLDWTLHDLRGGSGISLPALRPQTGKIRVIISHRHPHDMNTGRPARPFSPDHFKAYHWLLAGSNGLMPWLAENDDCRSPLTKDVDKAILEAFNDDSFRVRASASVYTCMLAGAETA